jgi:hypothetical protein
MTDSAELDHLLAEWAAQQRLTDLQATELRAQVVASVQLEDDAQLDSEWLWSLLRPLTALLDRLDDEPWRGTATRAGAWTSYLQLA